MTGEEGYWDSMEELEQDLRMQHQEALQSLFKVRRRALELRRQLGALRRYSEALERQLEPSVIEEIKAELEAQAQEEASQIERK